MTAPQFGAALFFAGVDLIALVWIVAMLDRQFRPGHDSKPAWLIYAAGAGAIMATAGLFIFTGWLEWAALKSLARWGA